MKLEYNQHLRKVEDLKVGELQQVIAALFDILSVKVIETHGYGSSEFSITQEEVEPHEDE